MQASTATRLIARAADRELLALPATAQASDVIHRYRSQTTYIAVDDPAVITDIDDPRRLRRTAGSEDAAAHEIPSPRASSSLLASVIVVGLLAPFLRADRFRPRIQAALEAALNRPVTSPAPST